MEQTKNSHSTKKNIDKLKLEYYRKYIEFLKRRVKEVDLTPDELSELNEIKQRGKDLVLEYKKLKNQEEETRKKEMEELDKLCKESDILCKEYDTLKKEIEEEELRRAKKIRERKDCELCNYCSESNHEIIDCPMNCCETEDGRCVR